MAAHLSHEQLRSFLGGKLSAEAGSRVVRHLEACPACERTAAKVESETDPLVSLLAGAHRADREQEAHYTQESSYRRAMAFVQQIGRDDSRPPPVPVGPPPLSRAGEPGPMPHPAPHAPPSLGRLREYELLEKLGQGGMGAVYKARHSRLNKIVAVKVLPSGRMNSPAAVARFEREMLAVGNLDHPNLIRAYDAGDVDGTHFLVMEYVAGSDLSAVVKQRSRLSVADACEIVRRAAVGLQSAHDYGLIHRDVKPSNLMLTLQGEVKVLDLGLALIQREADAEAAPELTSMGQIMGTLDYMAPEQVGDSHQVDARADVFSLGATLYKLLTGEAPFASKAKAPLVERLMALTTAPHAPLLERRPDAPPALATLVDRMLAKRPGDRPGTAAEVAQTLAPFAAGANLPQLAGAAPSVKDGAPSLSTTNRDLASNLTETVHTVKHVRPAPSVWFRRPVVLTVAGVASAGLFISLLMLGILLLIPHSQGTLRIEINDPSIDVAVKGTDIVIRGVDQRGEVKVATGGHRLIVACRDVKFETDSIAFQRDGTVALRVELRPGKVQVVRDDGQLITSKPLPASAIEDSQPSPITQAEPRNTSPEAASAMIGRNLLINAGGEELVFGGIHGWKVVQGVWRQAGRDRVTPTQEGRLYFQTIKSKYGELIQDVDVSALAANIDAGKQQFRYTGYIRSYRQDHPDVGLQIVEYRDAKNERVLEQFNSGPVRSVLLWRLVIDTRTAPVGTRWIRIRLISVKTHAENNDAYHDDLSLQALPVLQR